MTAKQLIVAASNLRILSDYRAQTSALFTLVNEFHACVDKQERTLWAKRVSATLASAVIDDCAKKTPRDAGFRQLAITQCEQLLNGEENTVAVTQFVKTRPITSGVTRAAKYNKSPSRAVRLARAARTAKRRGYF